MRNKSNKRIVRIAEATKILLSIGLPRAQQNERSALCLLALLDLTPDKGWVADSPSHLIHFNGERFCGPYSER